MPAVAAVLGVALVICILLLVTKGSRGTFNVCGRFKPGQLVANKHISTTIEIPRQRSNEYVIAAESDQTGIVFTVTKKTETSFQLLSRNVTSKTREPVVTWVLIPCSGIRDME